MIRRWFDSHMIAKRVMSCIALFTFVFSFVCQDAWSAIDKGPFPYQSQQNERRQFATLDVDTFSIPPHLGEVKDAFKSTSKKVIIHLQDAHCNYFAQEKISGLIEYLNKEYGVEMINLEGGCGNYDLTLFTSILNKDIRREVSNHFVRTGDINGAEFYAINYPQDVMLWGIEDKDLYVANLKIYRDSLQNREEVDAYLRALTFTLNNIKRHVYPPELLKIDISYSAYKAGNMEFRAYLEFLIGESKKEGPGIESFKNLHLLAEAMALEENIDFEKANVERNALVDELKKGLSKSEVKELVSYSVDFKTKRISHRDFYSYLLEKAKEIELDEKRFSNLSNYLKYVSLYEAVDRSKVMEEVDTFEAGIKERLYRNDEERELNRLSRNLAIMKNIFDVQLTRDDYRYYLNNKDAFKVSEYMQFIDKESDKYNIATRPSGDISKLDEYRENMDRFYEYSFKRDEAFLENLRFSSQNSPKESAIVMTGGFHSENLCELFRREGISYVSIIPKFTSSEDYKCPYFDLLAGKPTNMQRIFSSLVMRGAMIAVTSKLSPELAREVYDKGLMGGFLAEVREEIARAEGKRLILTEGSTVVFEAGEGPEERVDVGTILARLPGYRDVPEALVSGVGVGIEVIEDTTVIPSIVSTEPTVTVRADEIIPSYEELKTTLMAAMEKIADAARAIEHDIPSEKYTVMNKVNDIADEQIESLLRVNYSRSNLEKFNELEDIVITLRNPENISESAGVDLEWTAESKRLLAEAVILIENAQVLRDAILAVAQESRRAPLPGIGEAVLARGIVFLSVVLTAATADAAEKGGSFLQSLSPWMLAAGAALLGLFIFARMIFNRDGDFLRSMAANMYSSGMNGIRRWWGSTRPYVPEENPYLAPSLVATITSEAEIINPKLIDATHNIEIAMKRGDLGENDQIILAQVRYNLAETLKARAERPGQKYLVDSPRHLGMFAVQIDNIIQGMGDTASENLGEVNIFLIRARDSIVRIAEASKYLKSQRMLPEMAELDLTVYKYGIVSRIWERTPPAWKAAAVLFLTFTTGFLYSLIISGAIPALPFMEEVVKGEFFEVRNVYDLAVYAGYVFLGIVAFVSFLVVRARAQRRAFLESALEPVEIGIVVRPAEEVAVGLETAEPAPEEETAPAAKEEPLRKISERPGINRLLVGGLTLTGALFANEALAADASLGGVLQETFSASPLLSVTAVILLIVLLYRPFNFLMGKWVSFQMRLEMAAINMFNSLMDKAGEWWGSLFPSEEWLEAYAPPTREYEAEILRGQIGLNLKYAVMHIDLAIPEVTDSSAKIALRKIRARLRELAGQKFIGRVRYYWLDFKEVDALQAELDRIVHEIEENFPAALKPLEWARNSLLRILDILNELGEDAKDVTIMISSKDLEKMLGVYPGYLYSTITMNIKEDLIAMLTIPIKVWKKPLSYLKGGVIGLVMSLPFLLFIQVLTGNIPPGMPYSKSFIIAENLGIKGMSDLMVVSLVSMALYLISVGFYTIIRMQRTAAEKAIENIFEEKTAEKLPPAPGAWWVPGNFMARLLYIGAMAAPFEGGVSVGAGGILMYLGAQFFLSGGLGTIVLAIVSATVAAGIFYFPHSKKLKESTTVKVLTAGTFIAAFIAFNFPLASYGWIALAGLTALHYAMNWYYLYVTPISEEGAAVKEVSVEEEPIRILPLAGMPLAEPARPMTEGEIDEAMRREFESKLDRLKQKFIGQKGKGVNFGAEYCALMDEEITLLAERLGVKDKFTFIANGSYARRTAPYGTDLDLFIIMNDVEDKEERRNLEVKAADFVIKLEKITGADLDFIAFPAGVEGREDIYCMTMSGFEEAYKNYGRAKDQSGLRAMLDWRYITGAKPESEVRADFERIKSERNQMGNNVLEQLQTEEMLEKDLKLMLPGQVAFDFNGEYKYNIKEGSGGLRTIDILTWTLRCRTGVQYLDWTRDGIFKEFLYELVKRELLSAEEADTLVEAYTFLTNLRTAVNIVWEDREAVENGKTLRELVTDKDKRRDEIDNVFRNEISEKVAILLGTTERDLVRLLEDYNSDVTRIIGRFFTPEEYLDLRAKEIYEEVTKVEDAIKNGEISDAELNRHPEKYNLDFLENKKEALVAEAVKTAFKAKSDQFKKRGENADIGKEYSDFLDQALKFVVNALGIDYLLIVTASGDYGQRNVQDGSQIALFIIYDDAFGEKLLLPLFYVIENIGMNVAVEAVSYSDFTVGRLSPDSRIIMDGGEDLVPGMQEAKTAIVSEMGEAALASARMSPALEGMTFRELVATEGEPRQEALERLTEVADGMGTEEIMAELVLLSNENLRDLMEGIRDKNSLLFRCAEAMVEEQLGNGFFARTKPGKYPTVVLVPVSVDAWPLNKRELTKQSQDLRNTLERTYGINVQVRFYKVDAKGNPTDEMGNRINPGEVTKDIGDINGFNLEEKSRAVVVVCNETLHKSMTEALDKSVTEKKNAGVIRADKDFISEGEGEKAFVRRFARLGFAFAERHRNLQEEEKALEIERGILELLRHICSNSEVFAATTFREIKNAINRLLQGIESMKLKPLTGELGDLITADEEVRRSL